MTRARSRQRRRWPSAISAAGRCSLILLVFLPAYVIARSIAITEATPQQVGLPGGDVITSTMKDIHGAVMAGNVIAFVCGLVGVFVMQSALQGDRRLVVAGFRPGEAISCPAGGGGRGDRRWSSPSRRSSPPSTSIPALGARSSAASS